VSIIANGSVVTTAPPAVLDVPGPGVDGQPSGVTLLEAGVLTRKKRWQRAGVIGFEVVGIDPAGDQEFMYLDVFVPA
jgi:hypothetical protein